MIVSERPGIGKRLGEKLEMWMGNPRLKPSFEAIPCALSLGEQDFIRRSSLLFILSGTHGPAPDVSPRGDAPGFVEIVDGCRLLIPDRVGNNRIDTMQNILADPGIGLVFVCVDDNRVLTVSGTARILHYPEILSRFEFNNRLPRSVMEVSVLSSSISSTDAFINSGLWNASGVEDTPQVASLGEILADQVGGMTKEEADGFVAVSYKDRLY